MRVTAIEYRIEHFNRVFMVMYNNDFTALCELIPGSRGRSWTTVQKDKFPDHPAVKDADSALDILRSYLQSKNQL